MYNKIFLSSWNHLRYVSASLWHHSEVSRPAQDDLCWWGESWGNQAQGLDGGHRKPSGRVSAAPWGSSLLVSCVSEDDEGVLPLDDSLHEWCQWRSALVSGDSTGHLLSSHRSRSSRQACSTARGVIFDSSTAFNTNLPMRPGNKLSVSWFMTFCTDSGKIVRIQDCVKHHGNTSHEASCYTCKS